MPASVVNYADENVANFNVGAGAGSRTASFLFGGEATAGNVLVAFLAQFDVPGSAPNYGYDEFTVVEVPSGNAFTLARAGEYGPSLWWRTATAGTTGVIISHPTATGFATLQLIELAGVTTPPRVTGRSTGGTGGGGDFSFFRGGSQKPLAGELVILAWATARDQYSSGTPEDHVLAPANGETELGTLRPPIGTTAVGMMQSEYKIATGLPPDDGELFGWLSSGVSVYTNAVFAQWSEAVSGLSVSVDDAVFVEDEATAASDAVSASEIVTVSEGVSAVLEHPCMLRFEEPVSGYAVMFPCESYLWGFTTALDYHGRDLGVTGHGVVHRELIVGAGESNVRMTRRMRIRFEGVDNNLRALRRVAWYAQQHMGGYVKFYPEYYGAGTGALYWKIDWAMTTETERMIDNRLGIEVDIFEQATDTSGSGGTADPIYLP